MAILVLVYECVPQIAAGLGFDMASLINNPAFISMVRILMYALCIKSSGKLTICLRESCLMLMFCL